MQQLLQDFKEFTPEQKGVLAVLVTMLLPFPILSFSLGVFVVVTLLYHHSVWSQEIKYFLLFSIVEIAVSLFHQNLQGFGMALFMLGAGIFISRYRAICNPKFFKMATGIIIGLSILSCMFAVGQFISICHTHDLIAVLDEPQDRITGLFYNANLLATMCQFTVILCIYRYICTVVVGHRVYYVLCALLNFTVMYMSGCRAAFIPFLLTFPLIFQLADKKVLFGLAVFTEILALVLILIFPDLIPRVDSFESVTARLLIWKRSVWMFSQKPLLGMGPNTYHAFASQIGWFASQHCHNIYLDTLCSYGIGGVALLSGYIFYLLRDLKQAYAKDRKNAMFAMIVCIVFSILIHGILDVTILFPNTMLFFLLLVNSGVMLNYAERIVK